MRRNYVMKARIIGSFAIAWFMFILAQNTIAWAEPTSKESIQKILSTIQDNLRNRPPVYMDIETVVEVWQTGKENEKSLGVYRSKCYQDGDRYDIHRKRYVNYTAKDNPMNDKIRFRSQDLLLNSDIHSFWDGKLRFSRYRYASGIGGSYSRKSGGSGLAHWEYGGFADGYIIPVTSSVHFTTYLLSEIDRLKDHAQEGLDGVPTLVLSTETLEVFCEIGLALSPPHELKTIVIRQNDPSNEKISHIERTVSHIRFQQVDEIMVPVEGEMKTVYHYKNDDKKEYIRTSTRRSNIQWNPNTDTLSLFLIDMVDGSKIQCEDDPKGAYHQLWQGQILSPQDDSAAPTTTSEE